MKVYIGKYPTTWLSVHRPFKKWIEFNHKKSYYAVDEEEYTKTDKFVDKALDFVQNYIYYPVNKLVLSKRKRKIKIKVDNYDVWNADDTLAHLILPLLKKMKEDKRGTPMIDQKDVPKNLRDLESDDDATKEKKFEDRWNWVLDEMIYAFESGLDDEWEDQFKTGESDWQSVPEEHEDYGKVYKMVKGPKHTLVFDDKGYKAGLKRRENGRILFGKYFHSLWT